MTNASIDRIASTKDLPSRKIMVLELEQDPLIGRFVVNIGTDAMPVYLFERWTATLNMAREAWRHRQDSKLQNRSDVTDEVRDAAAEKARAHVPVEKDVRQAMVSSGAGEPGEYGVHDGQVYLELYGDQQYAVWIWHDPHTTWYQVGFKGWRPPANVRYVQL